MVSRDWVRQFNTGTSEGVARARTPTRLGIPTGTIDERETEREKEEKKRRGFSIPGFFGTALSFLGEVDKPISDRLGIKIPEMRGPVDEIGNIILQEATRPTNALIALGGVGLGARAGAGAARLGAQAAARRGVQQGATSALQRGLPARAALRTGQGALKAAQLAATPAFAARGISRPVRFAGEVAQVGGFRGAQEFMSETIPEDAPGLFRVGAPILVGLGGGLAGLRGFENAARALKVNTDNRAGMRSVREAMRRQEENQLRNANKRARSEQNKIAQTAFGRQWDQLTDAEKRMIERNKGDTVRLENELEGILAGREAKGEITKAQNASVTRLIKKGSRPRDPLTTDLRIRDIDDVRREAHIMDYATKNIENESDLFVLADQIDRGKYRLPGSRVRGRDELVGEGPRAPQGLNSWGDVPQYLSGDADAMLMEAHYNQTKSALDGWLAKEMDVLTQLMKDARVIDVDGKSRSLTEAFDEQGKLNEFGQKHITISDDGMHYEFSKDAEAWKDVFDEMGGKLDMMVDAEKRMGVSYQEVIGEDLRNFGSEPLERAAFFGDIFERRGPGAAHYFPRAVREEALSGQNYGAKLSRFGGQGYEKTRRHGFEWDENNRPVGSYIRLMKDNVESMGEKGREYVPDPIKAIHMRLQAGANRLASRQFLDEINLRGDTVTQRMYTQPSWGQARQALKQVTDSRKSLANKIGRLERRVDDLKRKGRREERQVGRTESRVDRNRARMGQLERQSARTFLPYLDQLVDDVTLVGTGKGALRKKEGSVISKLRVARDRLRKATENDTTSPESIADLLDEAQKQFDRASSVMDDWSVRADSRARRGADSGSWEAINTINQLDPNRIPTGRNPSRMNQAQLQRVLTNNDERFTRALGREDELQNRLGELRRDLDSNVAAEASILRDVDELKVELDADTEVLGFAKQNYEQAKAQAGDVLQGEAKIADFAAGGRIFDEDFATQINSFMQDNRDLLPYIGTFNNFARAVNATLDLSAIGIQGLLAIGIDPIRSARLIAMTTMAIANPSYYNRWVIDNTKSIDEFLSHGGYWAGLNDAGEFIFPDKLTKIPLGGGKVIEAANFHFARTGNALRLMMFERAKANRGMMRHIFGDSGESQMDKAVGNEREMVEMINNATGFRSGKPTELESALLFAPRFFKSQLNLAAKAATRPGVEGKMAREMLMKTLTTAAAVTWGFNAMQNKETEWNPIRYDAEGNPHYNSNFMRIKTPTGEDVSLLGTYDSLLGLIFTGITEGPTGAGVRLFSTKASPALNLMTDFITQETFQGDPIQFQTDDPRMLGMSAIRLARGRLPFSLQSTIELAGEGASLTEIATGTLANLTGIKATRQTPRERRDLKAQAEYGKPWDELLKSQKSELEANFPEYEEQILEQLQKRAETGDLEAMARVQKHEIDDARFNDERRLAQAVNAGEIDRRDLSKLYNDLKLKATFEKRGKDGRNIEWAESDNPNLRALNDYFEIFDDPEVRLLGEDTRYLPINWQVAEQKIQDLLASVPQEVRDYINDYTMMDVNDHPEEIRGFLEARHYVSRQTNYWGQKQEAFEVFQPAIERIAGQPISNFRELEVFIRQNPGGASRALDNLRKRIDRDTTRRRERLRRANPALDVALVVAYGYEPLTAAGKQVELIPTPQQVNTSPAVR